MDDSLTSFETRPSGALRASKMLAALRALRSHFVEPFLSLFNIIAYFGGEAGIRTLGGGVPLNGFQDRRLQPLSHLSSTIILCTTKVLGSRIPQIRPRVKENGFRIAVHTFFRAKALMNKALLD